VSVCKSAAQVIITGNGPAEKKYCTGGVVERLETSKLKETCWSAAVVGRRPGRTESQAPRHSHQTQEHKKGHKHSLTGKKTFRHRGCLKHAFQKQQISDQIWQADKKIQKASSLLERLAVTLIWTPVSSATTTRATLKNLQAATKLQKHVWEHNSVIPCRESHPACHHGWRHTNNRTIKDNKLTFT
jgi:hypothetical protein